MKRPLLILILAALPCASGAANIPEGAVVWLDATGLQAGSVAQWEDKSGCENHVRQAEHEGQPMAVEGAFGERIGVRFAGNDSLSRTPLAGFGTGDRAFHVFLVMRAEMDGRSPNPRLLDLWSSKDDRRGFWVGYQNNGRNRLGISHGDEGEAATKSWDGAAHLLEVVYRGGQNWEQILDGEPDGGGQYTQRPFLGFAGPVSLTLGQHLNYRGANTYYRGDLAEVLIFSRVLSQAEQFKLGKTLAEKYGLPSRYNREVLGPTGLITDADRAHWAWQKLDEQIVPKVQGEVRTPVDQFVLSQLEAKGFSFAPCAPATTLARRLALDLTGLPVPVEWLREFVDDNESGAYERLVDRLLASPRFGERWARHWLDAAGYVDVSGVDNDAGTIKLAPGKWRYRDWVIRAFNDDKPFDAFLTEQLAGDELCDWREAEEFTPETIERLVATTFLRAAADDTNEPEINTRGYHHDVLQRTTETFASNVLGLTWECAKCHDHKLDPIPQADYYRLTAFFSPAFNSRRWLTPRQREISDVPAARRSEIDQKNAELKKQIEALHAKRKTIAEAKDATNALALEDLDEQITALEQEKQSYGLVQAVYDTGRPPSTRLLVRGDYLQPGGEVRPALPEVFGGGEVPAKPVAQSSGRRLALAGALTDAESHAAALVARVQVNRIWSHLFGEGIVKTTGNLGPSGAKPTHPELLDWLAARFVTDGWQLKPCLKRLVMSRAYQQSSETPVVASEHAPLSRMQLRRLESEAIRDSVLAVSGQLDLTMGGPPEEHEVQPSGLVTIKGNANRRSVYTLARRNYHPTILAVFDQPLQATNCTGRTSSAVVTQSLAMLNSAFLLEQSGHFAKRVAAAGDAPTQVRAAFEIALARPPSEQETAVSLELLAGQEAHYQSAGKPKAEARRLARRDFCQVVFSLNEFLYVP